MRFFVKNGILQEKKDGIKRKTIRDASFPMAFCEKIDNFLPLYDMFFISYYKNTHAIF